MNNINTLQNNIIANLKLDALKKYSKESIICRRNRGLRKRRKRFLQWIKRKHPDLWNNLLDFNPIVEDVINSKIPDIKRYYPVYIKY